MNALLNIIDARVFKPCNLSLSNLILEKESQEYSACEFELNNKRIKFRVAKITPTKIGQFVTIWKRDPLGPIIPFDMDDPIDFFMIATQCNEKIGFFIIPKSVLHQKGYVSQEGKGGKRALRVYPPWDITQSATARKTQQWQREFFLEITDKRMPELLQNL